jgi:hypothetical protein
MQFIFFILLYNIYVFANVQDDINHLKVKLSKLNVDIQASKISFDNINKFYIKAVENNETINITKYKDRLNKELEKIEIFKEEYRKTQSNLTKIVSLSHQSKTDTKTNLINKTSVDINLTTGWNSFSIPINISIESTNKYLGNHSVIWGFDGENQRWIKNPYILYPSKGYYIYIKSGRSFINLSGRSFSTDLGSRVRKDRYWYFLGTSEDISNIDYKVYKIIKYIKDKPIINPKRLYIGDTFWAYRY